MNLQSKFGYCMTTTILNIALCSMTELRINERTNERTNGRTDGRTIQTLDAPGGPFRPEHKQFRMTFITTCWTWPLSRTISYYKVIEVSLLSRTFHEIFQSCDGLINHFLSPDVQLFLDAVYEDPRFVEAIYQYSGLSDMVVAILK